MKLSHPAKLIVGALTLLPFAYWVYFMISIASSVGSETGGPDDFDLMFRVHLGAMLLTFSLMIFYIVYLFGTSNVPQDKKSLWGVVLFLGSVFAMPILWFLYIWQDSQPDA